MQKQSGEHWWIQENLTMENPALQPTTAHASQ